VTVVGTTGAALIFRPEMQAWTFPRFFDIPRGEEPMASADTVIAALRDRYPGAKLAGIDYPTYRRDSFLAYLTEDGRLRTVFSHPANGEVLGELPETSWISRLQALHFDLLAGPTGRSINGLASLALVVLFATGLVVWWPGGRRWAEGLRVDLRSGWKRAVRDLHGVAGVILFGLLMLWAVTGVEFAFPGAFRAVVNAVSPLTVQEAPGSSARSATPSAASPSALVALSRELAPDAVPGRIVLPTSDTGTVLVLMARERHGDTDTSDEVHLHFDQYTGELVVERIPALEPASVGDLLLRWLGPIHVGAFGGPAVRVLWSILALSFPLLAATGVAMWWNGAIRSGKKRSEGAV
jgi:uncharacterized iron-regulated membrane protein